MDSSALHLFTLVVVGTRPEAIKMLPLILELERSPRFTPVVVSTGQHAQLVEDVLAIGGVTPDVTLLSDVPGRSLNGLFTEVMTELDRFLQGRYGPALHPNESPRAHGYPIAAFVHGDTTSAASAALTCFHRHLPVAHVEAGLRTDDTLSPFPEELNRQLISRIAAFHLAPTTRNKENLVREGVGFDRIFVTGNTAIDALKIAAGSDADADDEGGGDDRRIVVVTAHRRENWGEPLERIAQAVGILAQRFTDVRFVVALHPNPRVADVLRGRLEGLENVSLVPPIEYSQFARLLGRAVFAISDSGGVQEEAPALGTPVLCTRDTTERQEGVDAGTVILVGSDIDRIVSQASALLERPGELERRRSRTNPYGDGRASERIVAALEHIVFDTPAPAPFGPGFSRRSVLRAADTVDATGAVEAWHEGW